MTYTLLFTAGRTILPLACETHPTNGGVMTECGGLVHPDTITFKSQKISYATGAAMLLSSFTIAGTTRKMPT